MRTTLIPFGKLGVALAIGGLLSVCNAQAAAPYQGEWAYRQTCGWQHSASVRLTQQGDAVSGTWDDGTARGRGSSGQLKGTVRDGRLHAGQCDDDPEEQGVKHCPAYSPETESTFVRQGTKLVWYRGSERYLVLHPVVSGRKVPPDSHCEDE